MHLRRHVYIASVALWLIASATLAQQPPKFEPLPISEGLAALSFSNMPLSICPGDEQWIAYQLNDVRRWKNGSGKYATLTLTGVPRLGTGGDIWLTNVQTGKSRNLTSGVGSNWALSWSPNGRYLAFYSDRDGRAAVWLWDKSTDQMRKLSAVIPRPFLPGYDTPNWTPDSRQILVKLFSDQSAFEAFVTDQKDESETEVRVKVFQSTPDPNRVDAPPQLKTDALTPDEVPDFKADLALIDVATGTVTRIARDHVPAGYWLSPDGKKLAFLDAKGTNQSGSAFDLIVVSLTDKKTTILATDLLQGSLGDRLTWSPNSTLISYLSTGNWFLIPATGGAARKVTDTGHPQFRAWDQLPLWSNDGGLIYFSTNEALWRVSTDGSEAREVGHVKGKRLQFVITTGRGEPYTTDNGRSIVLSVRDDATKKSGFYTMELSNGRVTPLLEEDKDIRRLPWVTASANGSLFYVAQNASQSPDIWTIPIAKGGAPRRLTQINPIFDQFLMGDSELIEWVSSDGARLRGALLVPAGYKKGQRYPLIVNVYGGALLSDRINQFGLGAFANITNQQFWTTRGYAVLLPDTPLRVGTPMLDLAKTLLPGVEKVVEMGIADPERLGIWGSSYGGYSTMAVLVQTTRFKAAAVDAGFANLVSLYGWMAQRSNEPTWQSWAEISQGRMGGTPWQYRERYLENSPVLYLDRVKTPVLIIQGTADPGAGDFYSNEIFMNLRRLGKEATYLKYKDGSHTVASFGYAEQVDVLQRLLAWFDSHLKSSQLESR